MEEFGSPKQRHGCVTAWLGLMIVLNALVALLYFFAGEMIARNLPVEVPPIMLILLGVIGVANVVFAVLLLQWKKLGFWGFIASSIGAMAINLSAGLDITQVISGAIGVGILFAILQIKQDGRSAWENME